MPSYCFKTANTKQFDDCSQQGPKPDIEILNAELLVSEQKRTKETILNIKWKITSRFHYPASIRYYIELLSYMLSEYIFGSYGSPHDFCIVQRYAKDGPYDQLTRDV